MTQLWHDIQLHRTASWLVSAGWLVLWGITVATWMYDPAGYSAGMPGPVFFGHLLMPGLAGVLVGWWQDRMSKSIKGGVLVGLLASIVDFMVLLLWSAVLIGLGKANFDADPMPWWGAVLEALGMGLLNVICGVLFGVIGGLVGRLGAVVLRHPVRVQP
jgi:hypothetical protein